VVACLRLGSKAIKPRWNPADTSSCQIKGTLLATSTAEAVIVVLPVSSLSLLGDMNAKPCPLGGIGATIP